MKKFTIAILIMFLFCLNGHAHELNKDEFQRLYSTDGKANGKLWNVLPEDIKQYFVKGLFEDHLFWEELTDLESAGVDVAESTYTIESSEITSDNIVEYINDFYSDPRNLNIPVTETKDVVIIDYSSPGDKETCITELRAKWNEIE